MGLQRDMNFDSHIQTQAEWEIMMSLKVLSFVRNEIYLDLRFLDIALSSLEWKDAKVLQAFATDGEFLYFSPEQVLRVFKQNAKFLDRAYLHTVLHCMFSHLWIGGSREVRLWHIACDIAVEYTIDSMKKPCTDRVLSWLRQKTYQELTAAAEGISAAVVYRWLCRKEKEEVFSLEQEFFTDDHCFWPKQENQNAGIGRSDWDLAKKWSKIARQTDMEQDQRGERQNDGEKLLAAQLKAQKSRRNYADFLRKFSVLREEIHVDLDEFDLNFYTYGLRHYGNMPLIEPLESRESSKIQEFVIAIDTSDSTSGELILGFLKETFGILRQSGSFFLHSRIHIIQCDNRVQMDEIITTEQEVSMFLERFTAVGGGGTDFRPVFSYVDELVESGAIRNLSGLLYFTDGKGIYPKKRPGYKTAFLFLEDFDEEAVPPWAMRMRLDPEAEERHGYDYEY